MFSRATGVPENNVRVQIGDVGGGFGLKSFVGRDEITIVMAAHMLNATVKWTEDRRENLIASAHARQERVDATMSVDADGIIQACDIAHFDDSGAFPMPGGSAGPLVGMLFTGPYKVQHLGWSSTTVYTNTCGSAAYRGPWMMETTAREEMMDRVAREIGLDPLEFRRRNILQTSDLPYMCPGGMSIEFVTPAETLDQVAEEIGYDEFRADTGAGNRGGSVRRRRARGVRGAADQRRRLRHGSREHPDASRRPGRRVHRFRRPRAGTRDHHRAARGREPRCRLPRRHRASGRHRRARRSVPGPAAVAAAR